jgi:hypothetical protein
MSDRSHGWRKIGEQEIALDLTIPDWDLSDPTPQNCTNARAARHLDPGYLEPGEKVIKSTYDAVHGLNIRTDRRRIIARPTPTANVVALQNDTFKARGLPCPYGPEGLHLAFSATIYEGADRTRSPEERSKELARRRQLQQARDEGTAPPAKRRPSGRFIPATGSAPVAPAG